jgi:pimeloyl-ACP methyl ester carboxylesterase
VLLHGGGVDSASLSWGGVGPRLAAAGYRVIAPDHPGYGESPSAPWPVTQQRLVDYVGELVDAMRLDSYAIGGLSLGGGMTIGHVLDRPQRVTGAMMLGSYGIMPRLSDGPTSLPRQALTWAMLRTGLLGAATRWMARSPRAMAWSMAALIGDPAQRTEALMAEVASATERGRGFTAFAGWQRDQVRWNRLATDYTPQLGAFARPALILHGSRDTGVPIARAVAAAAVIPDAELTVIIGARHWVQRDQPDVVVDAMLGFLGRLGWAD